MIRIILFALISFVWMTACSPNVQPERKLYPVAKQDRPAAKIFYPVRSVRPENPTVANTRSRASEHLIIKAFHYQLGKVRICEAAKALALSLDFSYYCAPTLFATKTTINQILTPYEFADWLEREKGVKVVIDRISREVRFLHADMVPARFPENGIPETSDLKNDF